MALFKRSNPAPEEAQPAPVEEQVPSKAPADEAPRTAPFSSPGWTMAQHAHCYDTSERERLMHGTMPLKQACIDGHALAPSPQSRGLLS